MQKTSQEINVTGSIKATRITGKAIIYKGRPLWDTPSTWKKVGTIGHNLGNLYNPSWMNIFKANDGTYRYLCYRDGSISPFYGRIEFLNMEAK